MNPLMVTTNASEVPMIAPDVVRTTAVSFVAEHAMLKPSTFVAPALTTGVSNNMKKLGGNMSTMVLFGRMSRAGAKDKYTETLVFPAMRSKGSISNTTSTDDETQEAGIMSTYVYTLMFAGRRDFNFKPLSVIAKGPALILAFEILMSKDVAVVGSQVAISPLTLLAPGATVAVTDCTK